MTRYYMHTLDGKPAYFAKSNGQLLFAELRDHWQDDYHLVVLRSSVAEIREDQARHRKFREKHGWEVGRLDYVIVSLKPGMIPWTDPDANARHLTSRTERRQPGAAGG